MLWGYSSAGRAPFALWEEVCGSIPHSSTISVVIKKKNTSSVPAKVHCEILLFKNLDQAEN